jgi:excinuclease ABC subunit C
MSLTHKLFGIRSCNEVITGERGRPCLEYDIKRCAAPCVRTICTEERYRMAVEHTRLFLEGRNDELLGTLRERMTDASAEERFEQAAQLRDAIRTIETLHTRQQKMAGPELGDRDAFGLKLGPSGAVVQVFQMRRGRVIERTELVTEGGSFRQTAENTGEPTPDLTETDIIQAAVEQFYTDRIAAPEVHVPVDLPAADRDLLEGWLSRAADRRVRLVTPKRGEKRTLLELAARNAEVGYQARFNENVAANYDALDTLRAVLALPAVPRRIECFDISTIQGSETVASMVVCEDGRMRRGEYRKFRIRAAQPDDFNSMHEVVLRRYRKLLEAGGPFPDLVLIDGGKGQLSAAYAALEELGLGRLVAAGIAKKEELLFTRDHDDAIALSHESPALLLIQRIRDEAHRFAVTFHRQSRTRRDLRSELDAIAGVGPRRRRTLLTAFGSVAGVRRATREELTRVVGARTADAILAHFATRI